MCAHALEVETHLRSGTKEDLFPRATGVEVDAAAEEVETVEVDGRRGFGSFSPRLAKHSAGSP